MFKDLLAIFGGYKMFRNISGDVTITKEQCAEIAEVLSELETIKESYEEILTDNKRLELYLC